MRAGLVLASLLAPVLLAACAGDDGPPATTCQPPAKATLSMQSTANPLAVWDTTLGCFGAELFLDKTPITAGNFANLTKGGFYNGTRFHRVIDGFIIQDGDPLTKDPAQSASWGTGGPGYSIVDEFPCKDGTVSTSHPANCGSHGGLLYTHGRKGLLSMANTGSPKTGGSQYFVTLVPTPHLDGKHAIFGAVVWNMSTVEGIGKTPTDGRDRPTTDVVIRSLILL